MKNILRPKQLAKILSVSEATIWRLQQTKYFPSKVYISKRAVGWFESDIEAWLEERASKGGK